MDLQDLAAHKYAKICNFVILNNLPEKRSLYTDLLTVWQKVFTE